MKTVITQADPKFERLFKIFDAPLPASSPMTDPKSFLSIHEDAIIRGLNESRRERQRIVLTRFSAAFGVFAAFAMLLTFSREARAFVKDVFYTVIEWFSPEQNESGVTFDIEDSIHSNAPSQSQAGSGEKNSFKDISAVDKLYPGKIFVISNSHFVFSDGYIQDNIICLNYKHEDSHVQIICEPIQDSGSVAYHFNNADFEKIEIKEHGTLYYRIESDGTLFGGLMTSDTSVIVRADNASNAMLEDIVHSICSDR